MTRRLIATIVLLEKARNRTPLHRNGIRDICLAGEDSIIARTATTLVFLRWELIDTERSAFVATSTGVGCRTFINVLLTVIASISVDAATEGFP